MTKFTKEQLISRALIMIRKHREMLEINPDYDGIARDVELFEIALAALTAGMEQEPVAVINGARKPVLYGDQSALDIGTPLYAAPQLPQPAVVDEQYQHLSELYHAQEKRLFKIAQRIKGPSFDKYAYSPSQAIDVLESALFGENDEDCRAAMLQGVEPDFREISNSSTKHFRENAETSTKCWCHTCRPVTVADMRFVVCPDCGNKRCPHANDHRNACAGSNEPGQEGSAYPAAPQQEVK